MSYTKGGLTILKEVVNSLPPSERKIAEYIIKFPNESVLLTANALGQKSKSSSAAVIRLCKSLGFKGFQELKIKVAGDLQEKTISEFRDIEGNESYQDIMSMVTSNTIQTLNETINILNEEELKKAVHALSKAKSINFVGVGASHIAARDAEQKFIRINKNAYSFSDVHIAATSIANKGPGDVVFGISFSGDTKEIIELMSIAKEKGVTTISMTKLGKTTLGEFADIKLHTSTAKEAAFRSGATSSRMAQLHVIDILFMCLVSEEYDETVQYLDETLNVMSVFKG